MTDAAVVQSGNEPFSLVRNDLFFRFQRRIGLIPEHGSGLKRRAIAYALVAWLPLALAAWLGGTAVHSDGAAESLLGHFGIHVRCLVAIPLLVLAEGIAHKNMVLCLQEFRRSGLVDEALAPRYRQILADAIRMRNGTLPWVIIIGLAAAWTFAFLVSPDPDQLQWAASDRPGLTFGAWWFLLVTRPIFSVLLLAWVWRLVMAGIIMFRIARLPLNLVVLHPDRVGGLGFLDRLPIVFGPLIFSVSAVVSASWAHNVYYHGVTVPSLYPQMATLVVLLVLIGLAPLLFFTPILARAKRAALLDYGVLLARHGRLVDAKWIHQRPIPDDPLLDAPELGPVADIQAMYQSVRGMRAVVFGKVMLLQVALPALLPALIVVATQWPLKSTLSKLLFALV
ncbi:hypothetical protein [Bordetella petrii]|uniref:hypothetical protein n=1 Tax=Bordetella petrii TaxID=94624 RepID=UPI001E4CC719|nr:hypothetical protein [Bordetella petrii]MCD0503368.1 hypothetical protein [Bordetella petrii]